MLRFRAAHRAASSSSSSWCLIVVVGGVASKPIATRREEGIASPPGLFIPKPRPRLFSDAHLFAGPCNEPPDYGRSSDRNMIPWSERERKRETETRETKVTTRYRFSDSSANRWTESFSLGFPREAYLQASVDAYLTARLVRMVDGYI